MGMTDTSFWSKIQQGLKETESLMNQKQYNLSMIKARQTLEYIVNHLGEKALIVEGDLSDSIDQLLEKRLISQVSKDHYHRIRMIGNKAVHEGNDSPYDAGEALKHLSEEINTLKNNSSYRQHSAPLKANPMESGNPRRGVSRRKAQKNQRNRSRRRTRRNESDLNGILKPTLIFLLILVLVLIFVKFTPKKVEKAPSLEETSSFVQPETASIEKTTEASTEADTDESKTYITKSNLNVRSTPSTDGDKLGTLALGTTIHSVESYDDTWTVIMFHGEKAYVATEFLMEAEETQP